MLSHMIREALDRSEGKPDRLVLYVDQREELYAHAYGALAIAIAVVAVMAGLFIVDLISLWLHPEDRPSPNELLTAVSAITVAAGPFLLLAWWKARS
jgi:hypothetical protein